jgi:hypothetical protein
MRSFLKIAATAGIVIAGVSQLSAATLHGPSPQVVVTHSLSAIVFADGTLAAGPAGTKSDKLPGGLAGTYEVIFPRNVSKCVYTATLGDPNPTTAFPGFITVDPRGTTANGVFVKTYNTAGASTDLAFHLHVLC